MKSLDYTRQSYSRTNFPTVSSLLPLHIHTPRFIGEKRLCRTNNFLHHVVGTAHSTTMKLSVIASAAKPAVLETSNQDNIDHLVEEAISWAAQHGLVYGAAIADAPAALVHAPISLAPLTYPAETFLLAKDAAVAFNTLIDTVSRDEEYLHRVLTPAAQFDDFTEKLLHVHKVTAPARHARIATGTDASLAIIRSDYMLHEPTNSLLQVELNTIASSFGCLSSLVSRLHRYILEIANFDKHIVDALPTNNAMDGIADALGTAVKAHATSPATAAAAGNRNNNKHGQGVMMMVVQPGERNAYDQRWLQLRLWERHQVRTIRKTLTEIATTGSINSQGQLVMDGKVVSVAYFRAGYTPNDYFGPTEWQARELIENSNAICCPTVGLQLTGAKKVQQDLALPGVVERFASSPEDARLMRSFFAEQWSLEDASNPDTAAAIQKAIDCPGDFVLKPQREGGGNNFYGEELRKKLQQGKDLGALILMQRIKPPVHRAIMVRNGVATEMDTLSELGIYGTYFRVGNAVKMNEEVGHLVRTKASSSDEGGVAAGFAVLDSPITITS